jgi:hypothetical protein
VKYVAWKKLNNKCLYNYERKSVIEKSACDLGRGGGVLSGRSVLEWILEKLCGILNWAVLAEGSQHWRCALHMVMSPGVQ